MHIRYGLKRQLRQVSSIEMFQTPDLGAYCWTLYSNKSLMLKMLSAADDLNRHFQMHSAGAFSIKG